MSREFVQILGDALLVGAILGFLGNILLTVLALIDWRDTRDYPKDHPDRLVTVDQFSTEIIRLGVQGLVFAMALGWVTAVYQPGYPEEVQSNPIEWLLIVFIGGVGVSQLVQSIKDLYFRRRILAATKDVRTTCNDTTFTDCPFISTTRREELLHAAELTHEAATQASEASARAIIAMHTHEPRDVAQTVISTGEAAQTTQRAADEVTRLVEETRPVEETPPDK